jgi:hypothetical protein
MYDRRGRYGDWEWEREHEREARSERVGPPGKRTLTERLPAQRSSSGQLQLKARTSEERASDTAAMRSDAAEGMSGGAGPLPHLDRIQAAFGAHDVSGVQAFVGGAAASASARMGAEAYASGESVAFAAPPDLRLAAHEAAHVVQQRAGVSLPGGVGRVGDAHEQHADEVAARVVRGESVEDLFAVPTGAPSSARLVQLFKAGEKGSLLSETDAYMLPTGQRSAYVVGKPDAPAPRYSRVAATLNGGDKQYVPEAKFRADCLHTAEEIMAGRRLNRGYPRSSEPTTGNLYGHDDEDNPNGSYQTAQGVAEEHRNQNAVPKVGQAFAITAPAPVDLDPDDEFADECQYHAAAVVARDGGDRITMEVFGSSEDKDRDSAATFSIYETDPQSQSTFHAVWQTLFTNGITITIGPATRAEKPAKKPAKKRAKKAP